MASCGALSHVTGQYINDASQVVHGLYLTVPYIIKKVRSTSVGGRGGGGMTYLVQDHPLEYTWLAMGAITCYWPCYHMLQAMLSHDTGHCMNDGGTHAIWIIMDV